MFFYCSNSCHTGGTTVEQYLIKLLKNIISCLYLTQRLAMALSLMFPVNIFLRILYLLERALYAFESSFHSLFSLTQGTCRLDYRRPENRSVAQSNVRTYAWRLHCIQSMPYRKYLCRAYFLALFRHLVCVGQRGCYATALEFCKLILRYTPFVQPSRSYDQWLHKLQAKAATCTASLTPVDL